MAGTMSSIPAALRTLARGGGPTLLWRALLAAALVCGIGLLP
jgi:peptide/nickel transport system permease protein